MKCLELGGGTLRAASHLMTKDKHDKGPKAADDLQPRNDPSIGPADIRPTAAEYERDAKLEAEKREAADKKRKEMEDALAKGGLPPGAQTAEEAKKAEADRVKAAEKAAKEAGR